MAVHALLSRFGMEVVCKVCVCVCDMLKFSYIRDLSGYYRFYQSFMMKRSVILNSQVDTKLLMFIHVAKAPAFHCVTLYFTHRAVYLSKKTHGAIGDYVVN